MNENVKKAVTLLPVILVPLLNERKRIKQHPDVQKLEEKSSHAYHAAKDKSTNALSTVKNAGATTYTTGRTALSKVSGAIEEKRSERLHTKEMKQYEDSLKEAEALESRFQKDKEKHRKSRLKEIPKSEVPKIMQSQDENNDGVSYDSQEADPVAPEIKTDMKSNPDNYGFALAYEDNHASSRLIADEDDQDDVYSTEDGGTSDRSSSREDDNLREVPPNNEEQERLDNMNQNMNHYIEKNVKGHEEETYENGPLFTKHKNILDPKHATSKSSSSADDQDSLFNRHRTMQEERVSEIGRRTGEPSSMTKSKKQMKLEKKIEKQRRKQYK
ncbi:hypothetical protein ACFPFV_03630 [Salinicoccus siamensis]|uniref:Uncharacterized protein n=1 Tax=Salinicoccus siamensis TaxID=381830 RepID=A0ABV5Z0D2_9STAP